MTKHNENETKIHYIVKQNFELNSMYNYCITPGILGFINVIKLLIAIETHMKNNLIKRLTRRALMFCSNSKLNSELNLKDLSEDGKPRYWNTVQKNSNGECIGLLVEPDRRKHEKLLLCRQNKFVFTLRLHW